MKGPEPTETAILQIADAVGGLMESWGFKRNLGRLWTVLYLDERPLSAPELCERLALSTGAVSMLLAELGQWGAVRKTWVVGERREHYEAETNIWKMVSRVLRERELRWIQSALEAFESAQATLARAPGGKKRSELDERAAARSRLVAERVAGLTELARIGAHLLESLLQGEAVDHLPIKQVSELAKLGKP